MTAPAARRPAAARVASSRVAARAVLVVLAVGAALVAVWPLLVMVSGGVPLDPMAQIAHVSGMVAGYAVLVMLALMSRWPLFERGIGADVLTRWHSRGGRVILGLVVTHGVFAVLAWSRLTAQSPLGAWTQVLTWPGWSPRRSAPL